VCVTFVFGALLEYALVNYASRSDAQRLAKRKHHKQWELDHCAFDPEHMEDMSLPPGHGPPPPGHGMPPPPMGMPGGPGGGPPQRLNGGGSFSMVRHYCIVILHEGIGSKTKLLKCGM
jgi:hypothetical protein